MDYKPVVLIIDDQEENRFTLKLVLKKEAYDFIEACNGKEGLEQALLHQPDIILMDAVMPVMDGFDASKAIRLNSTLERVPILMVTALSDKEDKLRALEMGVNDFVSKPFDKEEVVARCRSYVNMSLLNKSYISAIKHPRTGLPNKASLVGDIEERVPHPKLILLWLNGFENLEEFYGPAVATEIEKMFASDFLVNQFKHERLFNVYHTGKGEFALLFDDRSKTMEDKEMERLCIDLHNQAKNRIFEPAECEASLDIHISASYIDEVENIYEKARAGLKQGTRLNKDIVNAKELIEAAYKEVSNNITWTRKIKQALNDGRIQAFYQPLYNNKTNQIEKYESLVRLIQEDGEVISPYFFLNIAQKSKQYLSITKRVFDQACSTFKDSDKKFSINLSGIDIEDESMRSYLVDALKSDPVIAKKVVFELLEDENFKDYDILKQFICEVKAMGVQIAIDDFGSGYSNFVRLLDFQPDILKIDGSLIKNIVSDSFSLNVVKTIKDFADKMKIKTVAEFVSDGEIQKIIQELGIDYTQGYYISEPLSKDAL